MNPFETCATDCTTSTSNQGMIENIDAFSTRSAKEHASAIILEQIIYLNNCIKEYERQITACREEILSWKSRQNKLCDVARLPEDVLVNIWSYLASNAGENLGSLRNWLSISHVCSYWRRLSINAPSLWRWPCILRPKLASYLLDRAKTPPSLIVDFKQVHMLQSENGRGSVCFDVAGQLLQRAESLTLRAESRLILTSWLTRDFLSLLNQTQHLPNLKYMLFIYRNTLPPASSQAHPELDLINLVKAAPCLQHVELHNWSILGSPSQLTPLSQLTTLIILLGGGESVDSRRASLPQVSLTLKMLPNLSEVELQGVFRALTDDDRVWSEKHPRPVLLHSLRFLLVSSSVETLELFFSHVSRLPTTQVVADVQWCGSFPSLDDRFSRFEALIAAATSHMRAPIHSLSVGPYKFHKDYHYFAFGAQPISCFQSPGYDPEITVLWPKRDTEIISELPRLHMLQHLEELKYRFGNSTIEMWKGFGSISSLEFVGCWDIEGNPEFLKVLASYRPSGESIFDPVTTHEHPSVEQSLPRSHFFFPSLSDVSTPRSDSVLTEMTRILSARCARMGSKKLVIGTSLSQDGVVHLQTEGGQTTIE